MSSYSSYSEEETDVENLPLRSKSTRKRILRNVDDLPSEDDEFWKNPLFEEKGEAEKDDYIYERQSDVEISDSSAHSIQIESEEGELEDKLLLKEEREAARNRNMGVYKDPLLKKKTNKKDNKKRKKRSHKPYLPIKKYSLRKSTSKKSAIYKNVKVSDFEKKKKRVVVKKPREIFTQDELLSEAKKTEEKNLIELKGLILEEQLKKEKMSRQIPKRIQKPFLRLESGRNYKFLSLVGSVRTADSIFSHRLRNEFYSVQQKCLVTGEKAIYRDPKTNIHYSDQKSFSVIREDDKLKNNKNAINLKISKSPHNFKSFKPSFLVKIKKPDGWYPGKNRRFFENFAKYKTLVLRIKTADNNTQIIKIPLKKRRNKDNNRETDTLKINDEKISPKMRDFLKQNSFSVSSTNITKFINSQHTFMNKCLEVLRSADSRISQLTVG